jgi:hypothetical protein
LEGSRRHLDLVVTEETLGVYKDVTAAAVTEEDGLAKKVARLEWPLCVRG